MSRQAIIGLEVVDQFPVINADGLTKQAGIDPGDFGLTIWRDGVEQVGHPVTVTEIGGGEYRVAFTPTATGFWFVEVWIPYNGERWKQGFDVVKPALLGVL